jgi:hypothetical protein
MAQLDLTITIRTPQGVTLATALTYFCKHHGYEEEIREPDGKLITNPESKAQFAKRIVARQIAQAINHERTQEALQAVVLIEEQKAKIEVE